MSSHFSAVCAHLSGSMSHIRAVRTMPSEAGTYEYVAIVSHFASSPSWMGAGDEVAWTCRRMRRHHLTWNQGVTMSQNLVDLPIDSTLLDPLDAAIT